MALTRSQCDRLVWSLMIVAMGKPWLESLAPFQPRVEYRLGIRAETLRVQLSFPAKELVFLTPSALRLGLKVGFESAAHELAALSREALGHRYWRSTSC